MVLTTQCPSCQTTFRVASDQLKLRAGLVRCGACHVVFDGGAHSLGAAVATSSPSSDMITEAAVAFADRADGGLERLAEPSTEPATDIPQVDSEAPAPEAAAHPDTEIETDVDAPAPAASDIVPEAESPPPPDTFSNAYLLPLVAARTTETIQEEADAEEPPGVEEPSFVTRARRTEQRDKALRVGLWLGSVLLFFTLLGQATYSLRNTLAAYLPQSQPVLQRICVAVGCKLELLTQIDAIAIEATELQQSTVLKDALVLSTLLRNRSSVTQAWPNIELSLNDANEKVIVRRVFTAADYLPQPKDAAKGFAANSEQAVKLVFEVSQLKPSGFRVYLFYP